MKINQVIYDRLKELARKKDLITYGEIAPLVDLNMENPDDRNKMATLLGEISTYEHNDGRPMLSSIVVLAESRVPGEGFFKLARELGIHYGNKEQDNSDFFALESKKVFNYWENH